MKLYYHPVSTTSRPVVLFAAESGIPLDLQVVDLFTGEQYKPDYSSDQSEPPGAGAGGRQLPPDRELGNPQVSRGQDRLSRVSQRIRSKRARVNERMDWFNTGFYRDFSYGFIYPQIFPFMKRPDDDVQAGTIAWGKDKALGWLKVLDESLLGPHNALPLRRRDHDRRLSGRDDGRWAARSSTASSARIRTSARWLGNMKALKSWDKVNEAFYKYVVDPNKGKEFVQL